ncbi:hypothetical protein GHK92_17970 [Nocardioides sp. dk4132]|uniref:DUF6069 family protein n=1 Tax=unclassified Nocardioides TaxID=2615069 RepID=UPI0012972803|nr:MULTISPECIES: DUF6069 family protein [unclassified Nocardioides]MQW77762.1 hypothetical protein [Nocardioides sp. dk4132]QGA07051.1 hypothetical protein GFH29_06400 [Nocardioides sp. dk884]
MTRTRDPRIVAAPAPDRTTHRFRGLAVTGLVATVVAMALTTAVAALAAAGGVDLEVPADGERIPLAGVTTMTGVFSLLGVVLAAAFLRFSARPAPRFAWTAGALTAASLVPPLLSGADAATASALVGLHLVAAGVMVPALWWGLRTRTG